MYLRAIFFEHTLDMQTIMPEYLRYIGKMPRTGHMPNRCPIGPVIFWIPSYLVGVAYVWIRELIMHLPHSKGDTPLHAWFAALGTVGGVLVGWRAMYVLIERHLGRIAACIGSIAAVGATPLVWYAVTQPMYQHGLAFAFVALLIERWDRTLGDSSRKRFAVLGVLGGFAMAMRAQEVVYLVPIGIEVGWHLVRDRDRRPWLIGGLVFVGAALLAFSPQLMVWQYYTGLPKPPQVEAIRWSTPFFVVSLFSTRSGLFPWSPVAYLAVVGLVIGARRAPKVTWALLLAFLLELYIIAAAWVIHGAYSYGARRLSDAALLMGLAVGLLVSALARPAARWAVASLVAALIALNVWAMELQRWGGVASSGAFARTTSRWLDDAGVRPSIARFFERVGGPFVQPAGWLFALYHHVPAATFEGVVGNFLLERDWLYYEVLNKTLPMNRYNRWYGPNGLTFPDDNKAVGAVVTGRVRLLLPMFAKEPVTMVATGTFTPGLLHMNWNGNPLDTVAGPTSWRIVAPAPYVNAGINEVWLDLPVGTKLTQLDFVSTTKWWQ
jgi:hypothetical protein